MKKLSIALVLLLTVGLVGAFAVDFEPVVDFSADVTNTFGVDLNDDVSTGFALDANADLSVMFVDTTVEKGEGDVYGWIQVEDMELGLMADEGTDPATAVDDGIVAASIGDISARVIFTPAYVQLSTAPGFSWDNAEQIRVDATDDADPLASTGTSDIHTTNAGIIVGADGLSDMIDVAFKIGSLATYDKDYDTMSGAPTGTANTDNWYAFGLDVTVTPAEMFSLDLGFVTSNADQTARVASMGFTANPELTLDVMSGLVVGLPVDVSVYDADNSGNPTPGTDSISLDFAPMVALDLNEAGSNLTAKAFGRMNTEVDPGNLWLDAMVGFEEVADGFVAGLTSYLNLYLFDILDTRDADLEMGYGVDAGFSYDIDGIKPYMDMKYYVQDEVSALMADSTYTIINEDGIGDEFLNFSAGVELALIENTVFDLNYESVNLTDDTATGEIDKGRLTFATTVSY